ncbi:MAG: penicillin-binding protein activator [Hyphomicrobiales bacterium]|nr:penicillin-binding protein activator [Hyphomicrobiales bacterium]
MMLGVAAALSGCAQNLFSQGELVPPGRMPGEPQRQAQAAPPPSEPIQGQPLPAPGQGAPGQTLGTGPVRIALVAPLTQQGGAASVVGLSLRNAVDMAVSETGGADVTVLVKDDQSSPAVARAVTQAAIGEGAELILGPLFAPDVREAARVARAANKPMIAFSTDGSVAARGVYLLSFLVESYVDRVIDYAAQKGKRSLAALIPENDYGNIAAGALQTAAARNGMRVMTIERYRPGDAQAAVQRIAQLGGQIDALFIAEQADQMASMSKLLTTNGLDSRKTQILGTGLWNDVRALRQPALQGAWFAAPENAGFSAFAQRYRARFHSDPTRIATLAYDATTLAIALARAQGGARYSEGVLTNASGFNGADGVFRFRADGLNERGLSVLQISNGATSVVSPAPRSFAGAGPS